MPHKNGYLKQLHSSDKSDLAWIVFGIAFSFFLAWILSLIF